MAKLGLDGQLNQLDRLLERQSEQREKEQPPPSKAPAMLPVHVIQEQGYSNPIILAHPQSQPPSQDAGPGLGNIGQFMDIFNGGGPFAGLGSSAGFGASALPAGGTGLASSSALPAAGGSGAASSGLAALGPAAGFAALIGAGKILQNNDPDSFMGKSLHGLLGPSISQMFADPLNTLLGPFQGFTSSKARNTEPEWMGALGK